MLFADMLLADIVELLSRSFSCIPWILAYGSFHPCLLDVSLLEMGSYTPWLPHLDRHAVYHSPLHLLKDICAYAPGEAGEEAISESHKCMELSPVNGSSVDILLLHSQRTFSQPPPTPRS